MSAEEKKPKINIDIDIDHSPSSDEIVDGLERARDDVSVTRGRANDAHERLVQSGSLERNVDLGASRDDRLIALLCYVIPFVMSLIVLLSESGQRQPFQRFHAVQGLGLAAGLTALGVGVGLVTTVLGFIPVIGFLVGLVVLCLSPIGFAMSALAHVYYGYQAYKGKRFSIPVVSTFMKN